MEQLIINLVSGAVGGLGAGKAMPQFSLGNVGNIVSGLLGGGIGSTILSAVMGSAVASGGGMDIGSIIGSVASGGVGGGALMVIFGLIKKAIAK